MEIQDWMGPDDRQPSKHEPTKSWTPVGMWWMMDVFSDFNPEYHTFKFGQLILKGSMDGELTLSLGEDFKLG